MATCRLFGASFALAMSIACSTTNSPCGAPDRVTYNCQPSYPGCSGGPVVQGSADNPNNYYPAGCVAVEPACSTTDPSMPVEVVCIAAHDGSATGYAWSSPH